MPDIGKLRAAAHRIGTSILSLSPSSSTTAPHTPTPYPSTSKVTLDEPRCRCGAPLTVQKESRRNASQWIPSSSSTTTTTPDFAGLLDHLSGSPRPYRHHDQQQQHSTTLGNLFFYPSFYADLVRQPRLARFLRRRLNRYYRSNHLPLLHSNNRHLPLLIPPTTTRSQLLPPYLLPNGSHALPSFLLPPLLQVGFGATYTSDTSQGKKSLDGQSSFVPHHHLSTRYSSTLGATVSRNDHASDLASPVHDPPPVRASEPSQQATLSPRRKSRWHPVQNPKYPPNQNPYWTPGTTEYAEKSSAAYRNVLSRHISQGAIHAAVKYYYYAAKKLHTNLSNALLRRQARLFLHQAMEPLVPLGDTEEMEKMIDFFEHTAQMRPQRLSFNLLLEGYVKQVNVEKAFEVLDRMRERRYKIEPPTYTQLITLCARRRDAEGARLIFKRLVESRKPIPLITYSALMNANVEAGQWDEAIAIFEFLDSHEHGHPLKPDLSVCTTLMKAYILMGAPFNEVMRLYKEMVSRDIKPSSRTFALLLQGACNIGALEIAEDIFAKMEKGTPPDGKPYLNVYTFSIMIRGFIRAGQQEQAREYYEEMIRRGIQPSAATWSTMIGAYASVPGGDAYRIIQKMIEDYVQVHLRDSEGSPGRPMDRTIHNSKALDSIYGPFITAYAQSAGSTARSPRRTDAESVSEEEDSSAYTRAFAAFQRLQSLPGYRPSIHIYTALLDLCRKANDIPRLGSIWESTVKLALSLTGTDYTKYLHLRGDGPSRGNDLEQQRIDPSRRNMLCLPFSIYIDAMSSNHRHQDIADTWLQMQRLGFGFDAGNWNHLIVALLRAGEVDRAFWTAEKVILQPRYENREALTDAAEEVKQIDVPEDSELDSSLVETNLPSEAEQIMAARTETPIRPPNRAHEQHLGEKENFDDYGRNISIPEISESSATPSVAEAEELSGTVDGVDDRTGIMVPSERSDAATVMSTGQGQMVTPTDASKQGSTMPSSLESREVYETPEEVKRSSLVRRYEALIKNRHDKIWRVFASTLHELDKALKTLESKTRTTYEGDDPVALEEALSARKEAIAAYRNLDEQYPLTLKEVYRFRGLTGRKIRALV